MSYQFTAITADALIQMEAVNYMNPTGQQGVPSGFISPNGQMTAYGNSVGQGASFAHNGVITPILTPAAWGKIEPQITGVNDHGQVIGEAVIDGLFQGFIWQNGVATPVNFPGSAPGGVGSTDGSVPSFPLNSTSVSGINNAGEVVGQYTDTAGKPHGFVMKDGVYTSIDVTAVWGVQSNGDIYGSNVGADGSFLGFTAHVTADHVTSSLNIVPHPHFVDAETGEVTRMYYSALGRAPEPEGLKNWVAGLKGGISLLTLANDFLNSQEFALHYGNQNTHDFITQLYANVLGREPDPQGYANWNAAVTQGGMSRATALLDFSDSQEHIGLIGT